MAVAIALEGVELRVITLGRPFRSLEERIDASVTQSTTLVPGAMFGAK